MDPVCRVAVRVRSVASNSQSTAVALPTRGFGQFEVDAVFDESADQNDVFLGSVLPVIDSFLQVGHAPQRLPSRMQPMRAGCCSQGHNGIMLLIGSKGTGKTFTLEVR